MGKVQDEQEDHNILVMALIDLMAGMDTGKGLQTMLVI